MEQAPRRWRLTSGALRSPPSRARLPLLHPVRVQGIGEPRPPVRTISDYEATPGDRRRHRSPGTTAIEATSDLLRADLKGGSAGLILAC